MRGFILVLASLTAANALADTPFYVGGGLGLTTIKQDDGDLSGAYDVKFDNEESGYSLFAGYEVTPRIAIEAGYIDFGEASDKDNGTTTIAPPPGSGFPPVTLDNATRLTFEFDGYYINGQYHFPIGDRASVDLAGGIIFADSRARFYLIQGNDYSRDQSDSSSDQGLLAGAAFTLKLTNTINVRGTANYYQIDFDNVIDDPIRLGVDVIWDF